MQGIFLNYSRPKSKAEIKRALATPADQRPPIVSLEATSLFGNEYDGPVEDAPDGRYHFVGPDPYTSRKFYGTLTVRAGKVTLS